MSKTVLITGAAGFTGSHLTRTLAQRGYSVRAFVRSHRNVEQLQHPNIQWIRGDIRDVAAVNGAVAGVDLVFHLAALYRSARHSDDVYREINVEGTRNLLAAAQRHQVERFVHCSTIGVHGDVQTVPANESAPLQPGDIYQETKLAGEDIVQRYIQEGLPASIVRPAGIYGPGDRRFLKLFRMIKSRKFRMFGSGKTLLHLVYIDDLVDGFIRCGEETTAIGETYIIAGERYVTLNELTRHVAQVTRVKLRPRHWPYQPLWLAAYLCENCCRSLSIEPPLHRRRVEFFVKNRAFDIAKAVSELGFQPRIDLVTGLQRTATWYRQQGWL